jgi:MFS family permease
MEEARYRDFVLYQAARFLSLAGNQMQSVAVGWQVYALTGRALDLGYVGLAQFVPFFFFSLIGGHAADRFDRRRILLVCYFLQAACAGLLLLLVWKQWRDARLIYAALMLFGVARAFSAPAASALQPQLVPLNRFSRAVALGSSVRQVAVVLGPALGGLLYGWVGGADAWNGAAVVYAVAGCAALAAVGFASAMRIRTGRMENAELSWSTFWAGVRYVWGKPLLLGSMSMDLFAVLLGGAVALLPIYAKDILQVGPLGLGLLRSAPAAGAASMAAVLAVFPMKRDVGVRMFACVFGFGVATIVFGLSRWFAVSMVALVALGAFDNVSVVVRLTLEQIATPGTMRGRVGAVNMIFIGASNELGDFESGVTAQWLGTVPSVVVGGVGTCIVVLLWWFLFPQLRAVRTLEEAPPP